MAAEGTLSLSLNWTLPPGHSPYPRPPQPDGRGGILQQEARHTSFAMRFPSQLTGETAVAGSVAYEDHISIQLRLGRERTCGIGKAHLQRGGGTRY